VELDMTEMEPASVGLLDERILPLSNLRFFCDSCLTLFELAFSHMPTICTFELKGFQAVRPPKALFQSVQTTFNGEGRQ
jgi:hypothetical protein